MLSVEFSDKGRQKNNTHLYDGCLVEFFGEFREVVIDVFNRQDNGDRSVLRLVGVIARQLTVKCHYLKHA